MSMEFQNFFKNKKVFITGHTGFIGSWLALWLNELGANICGYALSPHTNQDNYVLTRLEEKILSIIGDIRDFDKLSKIVEKFRPEIIFHLAAQPIVRKSYIIPKETYDINVGGTVNIFEAFRKSTTTKILINMTSDKCYENQEWVWGYRENDRLGGYDPYSSSKACSELITNAYAQSFFKSKSSQNEKVVASVRSGNIIGGGDWQEERLIPDCMRAINSNQEINIRSPYSVRPWQYILEPIRGYLILAMKMWEMEEKYSGAWNFGPSNYFTFTVKELVEKIINYMGKGNYRSENTQELENFHETNLLFLESNKAYRYLGWKAELSIDDTIRLVCDWYMEENVDYEFDLEQINTYLKKVKKNK